MADESAGPVALFIVGPPAVGKMTVGQELSKLTGIPLFYNHQLIYLLTGVFAFGSPGFRRVTGAFNTAFFDEVARAKHSLITTWGWRFDLAGDNEAVARYTSAFVAQGIPVLFAELEAAFATRIERNRTENRQRHKNTAWATDDYLAEIDEAHRWNSGDEFPLDFPRLRIQTDGLSARDAAEAIQREFGLKER